MTRAILAALLLLPLSVAGCSADITAQEPSTSTLIYVSDYFSFVGADQEGRVAFALDNNRGRDGEAFQAEHFVVLHDERDRKSTRLNSSHLVISYAVFCL